MLTIFKTSPRHCHNMSASTPNSNQKNDRSNAPTSRSNRGESSGNNSNRNEDHDGTLMPPTYQVRTNNVNPMQRLRSMLIAGGSSGFTGTTCMSGAAQSRSRLSLPSPSLFLTLPEELARPHHFESEEERMNYQSRILDAALAIISEGEEDYQCLKQ